MKDTNLKNTINFLSDELDKAQTNDFEQDLKNVDKQQLFEEYCCTEHLIAIQNKKFEADDAFISFCLKTQKTYRPKGNRLHKVATSFLKYAALLLITFFVTQFIYNKSGTTNLVQVIVPNGERSQIILPDGSSVWLNSGSVLKYNTNFCETSRDVFLEGEGFFDVVKNEKKPFIVSLDSGMKIKVLGTTFNVKAYKEDVKIETALLSGRIALSYKEKEETTTYLLPGDKADYKKNMQLMSFSKIRNVNDIVAWKEQKLVFKQQILKDIVNELNRFFDVEISIENQLIENQLYTASYTKGAGLPEILESLRLSGNFNYEKVTDKKWKIFN